VAWNFSELIATPPTSVAGFFIDGYEPVALVGIDGLTASISYDAPVVTEAEWTIAETPPGMTFADGKTLVLPQSGAVIVT